jgi:hypothetical protein
MRVSSTTVALLASLSLQAPSFSLGFSVSTSGGRRVAAPTRSNVSGHQHRLRLGALFSTSTEDNETTSATATKKKQKKLGLLTFDLGKNILIVCVCIRVKN